MRGRKAISRAHRAKALAPHPAAAAARPPELLLLPLTARRTPLAWPRHCLRHRTLHRRTCRKLPSQSHSIPPLRTCLESMSCGARPIQQGLLKV